MVVSKKDPTDSIRLKASRYPGVDEGTACTQSSFKTGKRAFLYIGMQGGRYKAMFKLQKSMPEASKLAEKEPDCYEVGSTGWVTTRFTADKPIPKKLWEKWLDESYKLSLAAGPGKKSAEKKITKQTNKKKTTRTSAANKAKPKTKRK
ncbi:MmcQ/YjbR family DNA-binding protein [candidate division CSSED10-310 bacterium]|uniref:MmcQ/YjbR family DNA-binding protein n=1 Tax=candidate division CSSED10-310 bacterium TaxID=2855610 RepID=A0ABV6Z3I8_UNCC1